MENNKGDELEDFIESSQVPTLRTKIREKRPNYSWPKFPPMERRKKKPSKRLRDNKTVSQCLQQVWKKSPSKPSSATVTKLQASVTNGPASDNDCIMFASTQQEPPNGEIQAVASVSLFAQQDKALARYIFDESTEAQVEEQLEKLLDGFQAEYRQQCAGMNRSPVPCAEVERTASLPSTILSEASMELEEMPAKGIHENVASPLQAISDILPNFSEELQRMEEILTNSNPLQPTPSLVPVSVANTQIMPIVEVPQVQEANTVISTVTGNVCLDLSKQVDESTAKNANWALASKIVAVEREKTNQNLSLHLRIAEATNSPRVDGVLDLRTNNAQTIPHTAMHYSTRTEVPNRPLITKTSDCGIQTNLHRRRRNVAVQHRPVTSFEFTDRNVIVLAQQFEADPSMLQRKLRQIAKTSTDTIWCQRDLSTVFTTADPYYANLKHFL
ncbi:uncharacterized protein LOC128711019 [Anopheles marshallii]|uniref:uncharacterized protein LOC128711019 n=1 Tax=Anopheles marshallii TaxID=1521116 RepID=UPI00237AE75C|nr:uncharacterized protein LOC128711019 [Anopheles marshallii]